MPVSKYKISRYIFVGGSTKSLLTQWDICGIIKPKFALGKTRVYDDVLKGGGASEK
jgi:hypothetical protein